MCLFLHVMKTSQVGKKAYLTEEERPILDIMYYCYHDRQIGGGRLQSPVYQNIRGSFTQFSQSVSQL